MNDIIEDYQPNKVDQQSASSTSTIKHFVSLAESATGIKLVDIIKQVIMFFLKK